MEKDNCPACGHEIGYHYEDGDGNVVCRFVSDCGCIEPHFGSIDSAMHSGGSADPERQGIDVPVIGSVFDGEVKQ
jgi:hypothetical protein